MRVWKARAQYKRISIQAINTDAGRQQGFRKRLLLVNLMLKRVHSDKKKR